MKIQKFEDLIAWQKAQHLAVEIYRLFRQNQDFGFRNQICNAVVSISNNIAEGFDRNSRATFIHFLNIARGSCSEVKSMLYLAEKLDYLQPINSSVQIENCSEISRILKGLINSLRQ